MMATAMKTWKTNGVLLRNRQIHDIVRQISQSYVFGCHSLWPSLSNPVHCTARKVLPILLISQPAEGRRLSWPDDDDEQSSGNVLVYLFIVAVSVCSFFGKTRQDCWCDGHGQSFHWDVIHTGKPGGNGARVQWASAVSWWELYGVLTQLSVLRA